MDEIELPHCSVCGTKTEKIDTHYRHCSGCGTDFYINPRPCNAIIITSSVGEILLTRRAFDPAKGSWDLPGGFIDIGETAEESVIREGKEELGVDLINIQYLCSGPDRYLFKGLNYHTIGLVYTARIADGQSPTPHDDVAEVRFFKPEEIDKETLAFPVLKTTLNIYLRAQ